MSEEILAAEEKQQQLVELVQEMQKRLDLLDEEMCEMEQWRKHHTSNHFAEPQRYGI